MKTSVEVDASSRHKGCDPGIAPAEPIEVVVVGASSDGPNELASLLSGLPVDLPAPVLIADHMPPALTQLLVERLAEVSRLPVAEAVDGQRLAPGQVWLAPGGRVLGVDRNASGRCLSVSS